MRKIFLSLAMLAALGLNTAAYFDGSVTGTTGPHGYRGTNLNLVIGSGNFALEPSLAAYAADNTGSFRTYALRGAWEAQKYTVGALAGATPEVDGYSNRFFGGDITFSLTPGSGGHARLAGPGSRGTARSGQGVTRIDVGVSARHTLHKQAYAAPAADRETAQTEGSLFAGAKIMMVNLSASYTGYKYGDEDATPQGFVPGLSFARFAAPKASVNVKLDIPAMTPLVTPFVSYTATKYKGGVDDSSAILFGAYIDLSMVVANVGYQIFNDGTDKNSFVTLGVGLKF